MVLIDIPDQAFTDEFGEGLDSYHCVLTCLCCVSSVVTHWHLAAVSVLERFISLKDIQHLVITQLTPKHIPSIKTFLQKRKTAGNVSQLQITLSNPARQLLKSTMGTCHFIAPGLLKPA